MCLHLYDLNLKCKLSLSSGWSILVGIPSNGRNLVALSHFRKLLKGFWSVETYGNIPKYDMTLMPQQGKRAMLILNETTDYQSKKDCRDTHNYLKGTMKWSTNVNKNYARKLTQSEISQITRTNYVRHHCVHNPNKPGKVRGVFDATAKFTNTLLNENHLVGPDLLNNLVSVLIRFIIVRFTVMGDIEQMFHQAGVSLPD